MKFFRNVIGDGRGFLRAVLAGLVANAITAIVVGLVALAGGWIKVGRATLIVVVILLFCASSFIILWVAAVVSERLERRHSEWAAPIGLAIFWGGIILVIIVVEVVNR